MILTKDDAAHVVVGQIAVVGIENRPNTRFEHGHAPCKGSGPDPVQLIDLNREDTIVGQFGVVGIIDRPNLAKELEQSPTPCAYPNVAVLIGGDSTEVLVRNE